ncbi:hypothetical protein CMI48_03950 [Candidatus Pacearchaeota archaeon]|nr:hypothetical protein [Candidatus Pacearchaeota archaeon]
MEEVRQVFELGEKYMSQPGFIFGLFVGFPLGAGSVGLVSYLASRVVSKRVNKMRDFIDQALDSESPLSRGDIIHLRNESSHVLSDINGGPVEYIGSERRLYREVAL